MRTAKTATATVHTLTLFSRKSAPLTASRRLTTRFANSARGASKIATSQKLNLSSAALRKVSSNDTGQVSPRVWRKKKPALRKLRRESASNTASNHLPTLRRLMRQNASLPNVTVAPANLAARLGTIACNQLSTTEVMYAATCQSRVLYAITHDAAKFADSVATLKFR